MNEEFTKFYQTYKLYIFPIIVGLSSLILIIFVIYPQTVKLILNQQAQGELTTKTQFLDTKVQALEGYDANVLGNQVNLALGFYPADKEIVPILGLLQNIASESGFSIVSISLSGGGVKTQGSKTQSYVVKLEALGSIQALPHFLSTIEGSPRLMRVSSFDVTSANSSKGASIAIDVDVLYSAPPSDLGSIDSPLPELSQKDQEVISKLASLNKNSFLSQQEASVSSGLRGKVNPFE